MPHDDAGERAMLLTTLEQRGLELASAQNRWRQDADCCRAAIRQDPRAIKYARCDPKEIDDEVERALQQDGLLLKFCHPTHQADERKVRNAVGQNGNALCFAHLDLTFELATLALERGLPLRELKDQCVWDEITKDDELMRKVIRRDGDAIFYSPTHIADPEMVEMALSNGAELWRLPVEMQHRFALDYVTTETYKLLDKAVWTGIVLSGQGDCLKEKGITLCTCGKVFTNLIPPEHLASTKKHRCLLA